MLEFPCQGHHLAISQTAKWCVKVGCNKNQVNGKIETKYLNYFFLFNIYENSSKTIFFFLWKITLFPTQLLSSSNRSNHATSRMFSDCFAFLGTLSSVTYAMKQKRTTKHWNLCYVNLLTLIFSFTLQMQPPLKHAYCSLQHLISSSFYWCLVSEFSS